MMDVVRKPVTPEQGVTHEQQRPRTAAPWSLENCTQGGARMRHRVLITLSAGAVVVIFPTALAIAVYYLACLLWPI